MAKTIKEERLRWVLPVANKEVRLVDAARVCEYGKRTLERWMSDYRKYGEEGLAPESTRPKTNPRETPIRIKERIIELRKKKKQCSRKIQWDLQEEGINIHYQTIQKIIKAEGLTRRYRTRKIRYNYVRIPLKKGELMEVDVKFVPGRIEKQRCYQFTGIDCATRWRHLQVYENADNASAVLFLKELIKRADFEIKAIKTDNGSCFTNRYTGYNKSTDPLKPRWHAFDVLCQELRIPHYLIDPGKPQQNAFVERSHRTDQERFYEENVFRTFGELRYKLKIWNVEYNNTKHCGLNGLTPNQALRSGVQNVCA